MAVLNFVRSGPRYEVRVAGELIGRGECAFNRLARPMLIAVWLWPLSQSAVAKLEHAKADGKILTCEFSGPKHVTVDAVVTSINSDGITAWVDFASEDGYQIVAELV